MSRMGHRQGEGGRDGSGAAGGDLLVVVCGLPGTGKTTVAAAIADRVDADRFRTDVVRKEFRSDPRYTEAETRAVYDELFERARRSLARGRNVVLDGTFRDRGDRERATALAAEANAACELVKVECDEGVVRERIAQREGDESDADFTVHLSLREAFDPLSTAHVTVDNSGDLDATRRQVRRHFPRSEARFYMRTRGQPGA